MQSQAYTSALRNVLAEIKNICPDVQASFIFDKEGTVIAADTESPEVPYEKTIEAVEKLLAKTETINGLNTFFIDAQNGKVHIVLENGFYHAMITTRNVDLVYLRTVSRVLVPTVMKFLDSVVTDPDPAPTKLPSSKPSLAKLPEKMEQEALNEETFAEDEEQGDEELEGKIDEEPVERDIERPKKRMTLPPARAPPQDLNEPANQLVVDTLSGLLVRGDTVQIDPQILDEWADYYDDAQINQVEIKSFNGNSIICKVKPSKDSKIEGKGIIRIPERACEDLDVRKGEMVKVKPLVEED